MQEINNANNNQAKKYKILPVIFIFGFYFLTVLHNLIAAQILKTDYTLKLC